MKNITGTATLKPESNYIYKDVVLKITGVYVEYKNGNGAGVYPDGSREYNISLIDTPFVDVVKVNATVIHDSHLENIQLRETTELPLDKDETLELINFSKSLSDKSDSEILDLFLKSKELPHTPPSQDTTSLYSDEEFNYVRTCKPVKIAVYESERGWGRRLDDFMVCLSVEDGENFKAEFNAKNNSPTAPDWYMFAEGEPIPIALKTKQIIDIKRGDGRIWLSKLKE